MARAWRIWPKWVGCWWPCSSSSSVQWASLRTKSAEAIAVEGQRQAVGRPDLLEHGGDSRAGPQSAGSAGRGRGRWHRRSRRGGSGSGPASSQSYGGCRRGGRGRPGRASGPAGAVLAGAAAMLGRQVEGSGGSAERSAAHPRGPRPSRNFSVAWQSLTSTIGGLIRSVATRSRTWPAAGAGRGPPPQAVDQARRPVGPEAMLDSDELPDAQVQGPGSLGVGDLPGHGRLEQAGPRTSLRLIVTRLPCRHGVTLSLNS